MLKKYTPVTILCCFFMFFYYTVPGQNMSSFIGTWDGILKQQQKRSWEIIGKIKIAVIAEHNQDEIIIDALFYEMKDSSRNGKFTYNGVVNHKQSNGRQVDNIVFKYLGENFRNPEKKIPGTISLSIQVEAGENTLSGAFGPDKITLSYQPEVWILKPVKDRENERKLLASNNSDQVLIPTDNNSNSQRKETSNSNISPKPNIAPDAITLDVDRMHKFYGSFAGIQRGSSYSLINDKGQLVIPYNIYTFYFGDIYFNTNEFYQANESSVAKFYPGYCGSLGELQNKIDPVKLIGFTVIKTGKNGYIDSKGRIREDVENLTNGSFSAYDPEGYYMKSSNGSGLSSIGDGRMVLVKYDGTSIEGRGNYINKGTSGERINYIFDNAYVDTRVVGYSGWSNGLRPARDISYSTNNITDKNKLRNIENKRVGFINRKGEFQIKPGFYAVGEFSEGIAFVCKMNEFNEEHWGAIDTKGNLVIPYSFRKQPGRFSHGRALVTAVGLDKIEYGFIDKSGKMIFTLPKNSGDTIGVQQIMAFGPEKFLFSEGYHPVRLLLKSNKGTSNDDIYLLDTAGNYIPIVKMMRKYIPTGKIEIKSSIQNGQFLFYHFLDQKGGYGIADIKGNILIEPNFNKLYPFEKESNLQYAVWGRGNNYSDIGIEGYIDRKGVFRILKAKKTGGF